VIPFWVKKSALGAVDKASVFVAVTETESTSSVDVEAGEASTS
jgi:hypothetical protein